LRAAARSGATIRSSKRPPCACGESTDMDPLGVKRRESTRHSHAAEPRLRRTLE
jgi:hypothetical protein